MTYETSPVVPVATSDRALMVLCHLSAFLGAPLLLPFIVWLVKRRDADPVGPQAAEALNFHLSLLLYGILLIPLCFIWIGIPLLVFMGIAGFVLAIVAAVKAADGVVYRYPLTIRFFK